MEEIPINAPVTCSDGPCGKSIAAIVDRETMRVTHLAVEDESLTYAPYQRLVPVDQIVETTAESIRLRCTREGVDRMAPFIHTHYVATLQEDYSQYEGGEGPGGVEMWGGASTVGAVTTRVEEEAVPAGEVAIHYGAAVRAHKHKVGQVDELVVDPDGGRITHLLLRKGHLWGKKDVAVPVTAIVAVNADEVILNIDKEAIEALPAVPVRRH
jgi:sporulation protein YlmC with PRC-barrel domain